MKHLKQRLFLYQYGNEAIIFKGTTEIGSYEVFADEEFYTAFSTKLEISESPKYRANFEKIKSVIGKNNLVWITNETPIKETIESQRNGQLLWRIFLLIAIILFFIESYVSRPDPKSLKSLE